MARQWHIYDVDEGTVSTVPEFIRNNTANEEDCPGWTERVLQELAIHGSVILDAGNGCSHVLLQLRTPHRPLDSEL